MTSEGSDPAVSGIGGTRRNRAYGSRADAVLIWLKQTALQMNKSNPLMNSEASFRSLGFVAQCRPLRQPPPDRGSIGALSVAVNDTGPPWRRDGTQGGTLSSYRILRIIFGDAEAALLCFF